MKSEKKSAKAKSSVKFKDLGSKKNPKGGLASQMKWIQVSPSKVSAGWVD